MQIVFGVDSSYFIAGPNHPFTVDKFPKATCDEQEQIYVLYKDPETKLRGPLPLRRYPPYKCGKHVFRVDYNLDDKSESMCTCCNPPTPPHLLFLSFWALTMYHMPSGTY